MINFIIAHLNRLVARLRISLSSGIRMFARWSWTLLGVKEAIVINLLRIALTALLFGNVNSFLFSISGAVLSLTIMIIMKKLDFFSCIGVSVCGGVMHNVGQIIAAVFIMGSEAIVLYLPVLIVSGVFTGVVIGVVSGIVAKHVKKVVS